LLAADTDDWRQEGTGGELGDADDGGGCPGE
jgi:hypothetical protein